MGPLYSHPSLAWIRRNGIQKTLAFWESCCPGLGGAADRLKIRLPADIAGLLRRVGRSPRGARQLPDHRWSPTRAWHRTGPPNEHQRRPCDTANASAVNLGASTVGATERT